MCNIYTVKETQYSNPKSAMFNPKSAMFNPKSAMFQIFKNGCRPRETKAVAFREMGLKRFLKRLLILYTCTRLESPKSPYVTSSRWSLILHLKVLYARYRCAGRSLRSAPSYAAPVARHVSRLRRRYRPKHQRMMQQRCGHKPPQTSSANSHTDYKTALKLAERSQKR